MIVHEPGSLLEVVRHATRISGLYAAAAARVAGKRAVPRLLAAALRTEERLVFVVGAPRSGTTFLASAIGALPGFIDLGEIEPLKALAPEFHRMPPAEAALHARRTVDRVRKLALVSGLRGVEQTPETAFLLPAVLQAYPQGRAVHIVRDGRDVVCSLLERGWLSAGRRGSDDTGARYGAHARFWVEPERAEEFERASDATRAAWAWRAYVTAAQAARDRVAVVRYEQLPEDPVGAATAVAGHLDAPLPPLVEAFGAAHGDSIGRYRRELDRSQLRDVERELGPLLAELGYPA